MLKKNESLESVENPKKPQNMEFGFMSVISSNCQIPGARKAAFSSQKMARWLGRVFRQALEFQSATGTSHGG